jgi:hypothetical protein
MNRFALIVALAACAAPARRPSPAPGAASPEDAVAAYNDGFNRGDIARVRASIGDTLLMASGNHSGEPRDWASHQFLAGAALEDWPGWMVREAGPFENRWDVVSVSTRRDGAVVVTRESGRNRFRSWDEETVTWFLGRSAGGWKIVGLFIRDLRNPEVERARDEAAAAIRALGGSLELDETRSGKRVQRVDLNGTAVTDDDVPKLAAFPELRVLDLRRTRVSDRGLARLVALPWLELLIVERARQSGEGVLRLQQALPKLRVAEGSGPD